MMKGQLLVGNITTEIDELEIRTLFGATGGAISSVNIPQDPKTGKNRGYALVEMNTVMDAQQAMRVLNGMLVSGRNLAVSMVGVVPAKRKWYKFAGR